MSANVPQSIEDFLHLFSIVAADGITYSGVRPSLLPQPFRQVWLRFPDGTIFSSSPPPPGSPAVVGYGAAVNVNLDFDSKTSYRWKITSILADGRAWFTYITPTGQVTAAWH